MMEAIKSFLAGAKLSIGEWAAVTAAVIIGGLVTALKIQGSQLHKAQIKFLEQDRDSKEARTAKNVDDARTRFVLARDAFLKAGGKLVLIFSLALGPPAWSDPQPAYLLPLCQEALSTCNQLYEAEEDHIKVLTESAEVWKQKVKEQTPSIWQVIPWPIWLGVGGLVGYGVGRTFR